MKTLCCGRCFKMHLNVKLEIDQEGNEFMICPTHNKPIYKKAEKNGDDVYAGPEYVWEAEMYKGYNPKIGKKK